MSAIGIIGGLLALHSVLAAIYYGTLGRRSYEEQAFAANLEPNLPYLFLTKGILATVGIATMVFFG